MPEKFDRSALRAYQARAERYHQNLLQDPEALLYLESRGINEQLAREYLLGICDDIHPGRLAIPYLRPQGTVWFNYRSIDPGRKPKYVAAGARHLYNTAALDIADATGEVAIAEGELDALVASSLCDVPAVGVPGSTQWAGNPSWRELFVGYQVVWVLADPDDAGEKLAQAILESLPKARLVKLPADVNATYLAQGPDLRRFMK